LKKITRPRLAPGLVSGLISIGDPFTDGVTSRRYRDRANAAQHEGFERGVNGAPAFFVNDQRISGPQNAALFEGVIDQILAAQP
jgi:predicted DsbA family dithiol-disulfide isomerase